jgi:hypothetical protein
VSVVPGYSQEDFLYEHIPYRLELLDTFSVAILLRTFGNMPGYRIASEVTLPTEYGFVLSPTAQLINLAYESGLINFRLMMEFLGVKANGEGTQLNPLQPNGNKKDFRITNIIDCHGNALVEASIEFIQTLPTRRWKLLNDYMELNIFNRFATTYLDANKAAAHLVVRGRPTFPLDTYLACHALRSFVAVLVYEKLGRLERLQHRGVWSSTMLHPDLHAEHYRLRNEMDEYISNCYQKWEECSSKTQCLSS